MTCSCKLKVKSWYGNQKLRNEEVKWHIKTKENTSLCVAVINFNKTEQYCSLTKPISGQILPFTISTHGGREIILWRASAACFITPWLRWDCPALYHIQLPYQRNFSYSVRIILFLMSPSRVNISVVQYVFKTGRKSTKGVDSVIYYAARCHYLRWLFRREFDGVLIILKRILTMFDLNLLVKTWDKTLRVS